jgi:glycosyltransferase involved in cell wall biosynthesis
MNGPLRVLCLDIEGGHGGSSRSLYEALAAMDRDLVTPEVWCRRGGRIVERYEALGIVARVEPSLPKAGALPRLSRNLVIAAHYLKDFAASRTARRRLAEQAQTRFDLVHFNHEGFAGLALWLRRTTGVPATMHLRTNLTDTVFARLQQRAISRAVDDRVFITPNEEASYRRLGGTGSGRVIFNPVPLPEAVPPRPDVPRDGWLNVASMSNFAHVRGTDRLIDVAQALTPDDRVRFVVAGDMEMQGGGVSLVERARILGVAERFLFLGHVPDPERVLAACDCLIKPTREANPWGRDVLEAMALGKPVVSYGQDSTFVETGETGVLMAEFDAARTAAELRRLAHAPVELHRLGATARERIRRLCNPATQARALAQVWREAVETRRAG